jgi:hypothetical protein
MAESPPVNGRDDARDRLGTSHGGVRPAPGEGGGRSNGLRDGRGAPRPTDSDTERGTDAAGSPAPDGDRNATAPERSDDKPAR